MLFDIALPSLPPRYSIDIHLALSLSMTYSTLRGSAHWEPPLRLTEDHCWVLPRQRPVSTPD